MGWLEEEEREMEESSSGVVFKELSPKSCRLGCSFMLGRVGEGEVEAVPFFFICFLKPCGSKSIAAREAMVPRRAKRV